MKYKGKQYSEKQLHLSEFYIFMSLTIFFCSVFVYISRVGITRRGSIDRFVQKFSFFFFGLSLTDCFVYSCVFVALRCFALNNAYISCEAVL